MPRILLHHAHEAAECGIAFAAWRGFTSPLRRRPTIGTCEHGGHELWWLVEAPGADAALAQLPRWIAAHARDRRHQRADPLSGHLACAPERACGWDAVARRSSGLANRCPRGLPARDAKSRGCPRCAQPAPPRRFSRP